MAISPDGRQIAFVARSEEGTATLWVRPLDSLEARELPGTEGARYPFWAPDSRRLAFFSQRSLKWIDSRGGAPLELVATSSVQDVRGGAWGADDVILFAPTFTVPLSAIHVRGGAVEPATRLPDDGSLGTMRFPSFLPDGKRFVFYASIGSGTEPGFILLGRVGSLDVKRLGPATSTAVWAAPGYLLYCRGDALVAHRFDDAKEELVGDPVPTGIGMGGSVSVSGHRSLSVANDGTLVFRADKRSASEIVWVDRKGQRLDSVSGTSSVWHYAPRLSPDGRSMAVGQYLAQGKMGEIWVHDLARKVSNRLSLDSGDNYLPMWIAPAGREILYNCFSDPGRPGGLCRVAVDRPGARQLWLGYTSLQVPNAITPDGLRVIFERTSERGTVQLWIRDLEGDAEPTRLSAPDIAEFSADLSPDGKWLAYVSDSSGEWAVYLRRLDGSVGAIRVSQGGGEQPLFRRDGRELFYVDPNGRIVAVPIPADAPQRLGAPVLLFNARLEDATDRQYDVAPDGQRFLLNRRLTIDDAPLVTVLDWSALVAAETK
jgi:Tol biopolymer transport system component